MPPKSDKQGTSSSKPAFPGAAPPFKKKAEKGTKEKKKPAFLKAKEKEEESRATASVMRMVTNYESYVGECRLAEIRGWRKALATGAAGLAVLSPMKAQVGEPAPATPYTQTAQTSWEQADITPEQATTALNFFQDADQQPRVKSVNYDAKTDSFSWLGPTTGKQMSMRSAEFEDQVLNPYLKAQQKAPSSQPAAAKEVADVKPDAIITSHHEDLLRLMQLNARGDKEAVRKLYHDLISSGRAADATSGGVIDNVKSIQTQDDGTDAVTTTDGHTFYIAQDDLIQSKAAPRATPAAQPAVAGKQETEDYSKFLSLPVQPEDNIYIRAPTATLPLSLIFQSGKK
jgi:hypothetical protein